MPTLAPRLLLWISSLVSVMGLASCGSGASAPRSPLVVRAEPVPPLPTSKRTTPPPNPTPDDEAIERAGQDYLELYAEIHPEAATALGLHQHDAELDDRTIAGHDKGTDREAAMLRSLEERFKTPRASAAAKTDLEMLLGALRCDVRRKRVERPLQRRPADYVEPLNAIFQMTARDYAPAPERAKNVLARLEKIPRAVEAAKQNLLNPPRVWTEVAIDRASSAKVFLEAQRAFLTSALPDEVARIDLALKGAVNVYDDYKRYLQREVLPRSNGRFSAGRELFDYLLKNDYFLDEGADEILAMGKKVFAETNAQMTELARRIDPKAKGWPEVTARIKSKHPTTGDLLSAYKKEVARARAFLVDKDAVSFPPGDDLEVVETPTFMRSTLTAAYDQPPPFDAQISKGFFFVTPIDDSLPKSQKDEMLRENGWAEIADTSVHEAYPGHHLQLSFARRSPSRIRRALDKAIFSEGWALYSEALMAELGYFNDEEHLIQLEWALVRAARIIIDVGIHVGDMTFEQAVKLLTDEVHIGRQLALSEVKRYTESPTQPSAYLVGREMILRLRESVKAREGAKFSLKAFHTDVLSRGTVPPTLLAKEMFAAPTK